MNSEMKSLTTGLVRLLRWSEKYTKTDMVYLFQSGVWNNLSVIIPSIFALFLSIAFANFLPKEVYGTYQYLLSLSALVTAFGLGGMQHALVQSIARGNEGDLRVALKAQLKWNFVPMGVGLIGALYYALHGNWVVAGGFIVIAIFAPLTSAFNTYGALLSGKREFKRFFLYGLIANLAYYAAMFIAIIFFKQALVLIFINLAINTAAAIYLYRRTLTFAKPNSQTDPGTVRYGAHLSVMNAFVSIMTQLDSILVFHFLGAAQLAVYSFATFIPERMGALSSFIGTSAYPKYAQRSLGEIQRSIVPQTLRAAAFGVLVMIAYILVAPFLFHILFPKYLDALPYTQWYAPVILLMAANLVSLALAAQRRKTELYILSFVNPILLITLQIPLLLLYGIWGMLAARLITDLVGILLGIVLIRRTPHESSPVESHS